MKRPKDITAKFKVADPDLVEYIKALEKENLRLQKKIGHLHVKDVSQQNEIITLKKLQPPGTNFIMQFSSPHDSER